MTGPSVVTDTEQRPEYDVTLTDGTDVLGFIVTNPQDGSPDPRQFQRRPLARTAIKTSVGESKYSDFELPYLSIVQDDWSGGRGSNIFENDRSRYMDAYRVLTNKAGQIILGPAVTTSRTGSSGHHEFLEYKGTIYAINIISGSNSILYRNGDRGAADSNSGALSTLVDATKSWTNDVYIGAIVKIIAGPGSEETQPWRSITDNDGTTLTVSPDWDITHTTSTEYVIVKTDDWTQVLDLGGHVTGYAVADDFIYFARGETASLNILRYNEYNNAGVWTARNAAENMQAVHLLALRNTADNVTYLWGTRNAVDPYGSTLWKMRVPPMWGELYREIAEIAPTDRAWSDRIVANVAQKTLDGNTWIDIAEAWTANDIASVINLDTPVDMTRGSHIGLLYKSSVDYTSTPYLSWDDSPDLGRKQFSPSQALVVNPIGDPHAIPLFETGDGDTTTYNIIPSGYYIYVGSESIFNIIDVDLDATIKNDTASVMTAEYYNGEWTSLTLTADGTTSGGKTLSQDGQITFTHPADWKTTSIDDNDIYWVRLKPDTDIFPQTKVYQITIKDPAQYWSGQLIVHDDSGVADDLDNLKDGDDTTSEIIDLQTVDWLYYCASIRYDELEVDVKVVNATASVLSGQYFNGHEWQAIAGLSDGTAAAGATFAQDGSITWTMPTNWQKNVIAGAGSNTVSYYTVRLAVSVNIDVATELYQIKNKNNDDDNLSDPYALYAIDTSNAVEYSTLPAIIDGDVNTRHSITLDTSTFLYVGSSSIFSEMYVDIATANDSATAMTGEYFNGSVWTAITLTDGTKTTYTLDKDGTISWSPQNDWSKLVIADMELYWMRFTPSANYVFSEINEIRLSRDNAPIHYLGTGSGVANDIVWSFTNFTPIPSAYPLPNEKLIKSFGFGIGTDKGAQDVYLIDGVHLCYNYTDFTEIRIPSNEKIIGLGAYSGDETGGVANPWVRTDRGLYEIQQQANDAVVKLPLDELKELASDLTTMETSSVYLMFALGEEFLERYYNKNLDDVGPNRDEGLPSNRRGRVSSLLAYPGVVFVAIDGDTSNYSSILFLDGSTYHDVYYTASTGKRIRSMLHQVIPGQTDGKLWFCEDVKINWMHASPNPFYDGDYVYASDGWLETAWMYANMMDIKKAFKSLKIFGENFGSSNLITNPSFESNTTGWAASGTNTISRSNDQSQAGDYSLLCTYKDNLYLSYYEIILLASTNYKFYGYVYVPSGWDGGNIYLRTTGYAGATETQNTIYTDGVDAKGVWVYIETVFTTAADVTGTVGVYASVAPSVDKTIYLDNCRLENSDQDSYVEVDYKLDNDGVWTPIDGIFDTEPSEEINFSASTPPSATGKRIKLKIKLHTDDTSITPRVLATLIEAYGIVPVKYDYTFPSLLADSYMYVNLKGKPVKAWGYGSDVDAALTKYLAWVDAATPLTLNSRFKIFDGKTVVAQSPMIVPLDMPGPEQKDQTERHTIQITCHDL